jgi:membrane protease subunit HflK
VVVCLGLGWLVTGSYSLTSGEQALIMRWGEMVGRETETGFHYHWPWPIETMERTRVSEVLNVALQDTVAGRELISGDANLVMVSALVSYDIADLSRARFAIADLPRALQVAGQQCLCRELAAVGVDAVMTSGQSDLRRAVRDSLQAMTNRLDLGVRIISVELAEVSPPAPVAEDFNRVASARVRKQEIVQEARGYAGSVVPRARGEARRLVAEAQAFATETLGTARSDSVAFARLAAEYRRAPQITSQLQWWQTLQEIFARCDVRVDPSPAQTIYYLRDGQPVVPESGARNARGVPNAGGGR